MNIIPWKIIMHVCVSHMTNIWRYINLLKLIYYFIYIFFLDKIKNIYVICTLETVKFCLFIYFIKTNKLNSFFRFLDLIRISIVYFQFPVSSKLYITRESFINQVKIDPLIMP